MFTIIGGDGKEYGPATVEQIRAWIAAGRANLETKAKAAGTEEWRVLGDFPEFGAPASMPPVVGAPSTVPEVPPADRLARLGAWFLDTVLAFLCCLPGMMVLGVSVIVAAMKGQTDVEPGDAAKLLLGIALLGLGGIVLLGIQIWLLTTRGQTVGKKLLGVRIVNVHDGENPGFVRAVLLRWFLPGVIATVLSIIPAAGFAFSVADACFIFRDDRRCIHDLIAGTRVVKA